MASPVVVREATMADRDALLRLHRMLYETHRDATVAPDVLPLIEYHDYGSVLEADLDSLLGDRAAHVLVAEIDERAIGYITGRMKVEAERVLSRRGTIEDWFVEPDQRGRGVGSLLLRALEQRLRVAGCEVLESGTWAANLSGRRAHEALGFHEIRIAYRKRLSD